MHPFGIIPPFSSKLEGSKNNLLHLSTLTLGGSALVWTKGFGWVAPSLV
jgi:hypothetical protein